MTSSAELFQQATAHHQRGSVGEAETLYRQVLALDARHADAAHLLGIVLSQREAYDEALPLLEHAVRLAPNNPMFHHNLGEAQRRSGRPQAALASFERATKLQPNFAEAHFSAGNVLKQIGQPEQAMNAYRAALQENPRHHRAAFNLANTLREQGYVDQAITTYYAALKLAPKSVDAMLNLGCALKDQGSINEALEVLHRANSLEPWRAELKQNIAQCYDQLGRFDEAESFYRQELAERPSWSRHFRLETMGRPLAASREAMVEDRRRVETAVSARLGKPVDVNIDELNTSGIEPPMALVYQGLDELPLKRQYAQLFGPLFPQWEASGSGQSRRHIGILTTHGHEGVFIKCMRGLIEQLPREKFRVTIACSPLGRNYFRQQVRNPDTEYLVLPAPVDQAAEALHAARLDVILYWEIGTDSTNYFLPFYRLAPVQCTTFGWPITSGIPTVDYFLSSAELEVDDSDQFFSERLVRLPTLPTYYYRPELPPLSKTRNDFGLPENAHVYFCGQRLRKFHPDFDDLIAGILRTDPNGLFVCIADRQSFMGELFRKRLAATARDVAERVRIVPWLDFADYLQLAGLSDVVLDTPHYGGGANTVYDALAASRPIVTLPGRFQRGRYALAANRRLELDECIATSPDEYISRAVRLARDRDFAADVSRRITQRCDLLFEDQKYVEAVGDFVDKALSFDRD